MNEPKRRGRPPKDKGEQWLADRMAAGLAADAGITFDAGDDRIPPVFVEERTPAGVIVITETPQPERAQAYALRIWAKQSISLSHHECLGRIAAALEAQGLSMEGVVLP